MNVALVQRQLVTHAHSGLNRATCDLAHGLHEQGHRVHVIAEHATPDNVGLPEEIVVHDISGGLPLAWAAAAHRTLARLHAHGEIDVASVPLWGAPGVLATRDPRFPTVVSCMTSACTLGEIDPDWGASPGGREALLLERTCVQGARHLHGLTHSALAKTLADYGGEPLTAGVAARGLRDRAAAARTAGASGGPLELLFVGRLEPRKGVDVLLEAMRELDGDVRLTLAGPDVELADGGTYRDRFLAAADPALATRVRFAGAVSDERLYELFGGADVICQPSRYESHGIVLIEAMMFGKPIVTTTGGGVPEVVEEGGNALLAVPGDARELADRLRTIAASPELRARFGERSRALYLARYEIGVVAREMTALLEEAIAAHERSPAPPSATAMLTRALDERAAAAEAAAGEWRARAGVLEAERDAAATRAEIAEAERDAAAARAAAAERERDDWRRDAELVNGKLWRVTSSRTWRLTEPLRSAARTVRDR